MQQRLGDLVAEAFAEQARRGRFLRVAQASRPDARLEQIFEFFVAVGDDVDHIDVRCRKVDVEQGFVVLDAKLIRGGRRVVVRVDCLGDLLAEVAEALEGPDPFDPSKLAAILGRDLLGEDFG